MSVPSSVRSASTVNSSVPDRSSSPASFIVFPFCNRSVNGRVLIGGNFSCFDSCKTFSASSAVFISAGEGDADGDAFGAAAWCAATSADVPGVGETLGDGDGDGSGVGVGFSFGGLAVATNFTSSTGGGAACVASCEK